MNKKIVLSSLHCFKVDNIFSMCKRSFECICHDVEGKYINDAKCMCNAW